MMNHSGILVAANIIVFLSWLVFWIGFISLLRRSWLKEKNRNTRSILGIMIQGIGLGIAFSIHRDYAQYDASINAVLRIMIFSFAALLAPWSTWLALRAIKILGKQWSLAARTLADHELIISGPYRYIRHPVYAAMLGLLVATGILITHPLAFIIAIIVFVWGTQLRIKSEEKLLIDRFGNEYLGYRKKVKAVIPFIW
jgi:protein-S-isoprenylcysteine O-methyltransferase Ste14